MSDHSEKPFNVFSVDNDELFTYFRNLSSNDSPRNSHRNNGFTGFAYCSSSSSISDDPSTRQIPQENMSEQRRFINVAENFNGSLAHNDQFTRNPASENLASFYTRNINHKSDYNPNSSQITAPNSHSSATTLSSPINVPSFNFSEYRISSSRKNFIVSLAKSRQGSQDLQLLVLQTGQVNAVRILKAVYGNLTEVMTDRYGCHVFNMIIDYCDKNLFGTIIHKIKPVLVDIACSEYGSYSIQKLITLVKDESALACNVTSSLSEESFQLMTCGKGRHVLGLCLTLLRASDVEVLYEAVIGIWFELAKDPQGCISINMCIDFIPSPYRSCLLYAIAENSACLSFHPSGTFVVQHVLGLRYPWINNEICHKLKGSFILLSPMQHGSHLVQKCIELSSLGIILFVEELLKQEDEIEKLALDQFGNFVIQTALKVSQKNDPNIHKYLKKNLRELEPWIGKTIYGVHVFRLLNGLPRF